MLPSTLAGGDTTLSRDVEADVRYDVEVDESGSQDGGENAPRPQDCGENAPRPQDGGENAPRPDERDGGVKDMADCVSFIFLSF